jgi:hypothetical protein
MRPEARTSAIKISQIIGLVKLEISGKNTKYLPKISLFFIKISNRLIKLSHFFVIIINHNLIAA